MEDVRRVDGLHPPARVHRPLPQQPQCGGGGDGNRPSTTLSARMEGYVLWPRRGKHLSFDGRMFHAAPSDLMGEGSFERQCDPRSSGGDNAAVIATGDGEDDGDSGGGGGARRILARRRRRVKFLVNVLLLQ